MATYAAVSVYLIDEGTKNIKDQINNMYKLALKKNNAKTYQILKHINLTQVFANLRKQLDEFIYMQTDKIELIKTKCLKDYLLDLHIKY